MNDYGHHRFSVRVTPSFRRCRQLSLWESPRSACTGRAFGTKALSGNNFVICLVSPAAARRVELPGWQGAEKGTEPNGTRIRRSHDWPTYETRPQGAADSSRSTVWPSTQLG